MEKIEISDFTLQLEKDRVSLTSDTVFFDLTKKEAIKVARAILNFYGEVVI